MALQAVLFDIDGLMIDSERVSRRSWREVMSQAGYTLDDDVYLRMIGRTEKDVRGILHEAYGADFPFDRMYSDREERFIAFMTYEGIPVKPGLPEVLDWVQSHHIPYAVASSTYCKLAEAKLVSAGIREYFDVMVTGDEVVNGKPAPDLFLKAAEKLGIQPGNCLVLEDSQAGIQAAHAAGMHSILVPDLQAVDPVVASYTVAVVNSLDEALPHMEKLLD